METIYDRTRMLIGRTALEKLRSKSVLVIGLGGVGGHAVEALARTGIGTLGIADCDKVDITNINRQIIALQSTIGRQKTEVMTERIRSINPDIVVKGYDVRVTEENIDSLDLAEYDYIIDAVDDVKAKLAIIEEAVRLERPVVSCMGTGNKLDPLRLQIKPVEKSHTCPLAKVIRKELSLRGIKRIPVVFSDEMPSKAEIDPGDGRTPASISFVPASAGMVLASKAVRDLMES